MKVSKLLFATSIIFFNLQLFKFCRYITKCAKTEIE